MHIYRLYMYILYTYKCIYVYTHVRKQTCIYVYICILLFVYTCICITYINQSINQSGLFIQFRTKHVTQYTINIK